MKSWRRTSATGDVGPGPGPHLLDPARICPVIYMLVEAAQWEERCRLGTTAAEPGPGGFVHCCDEPQLAHVRATYFPEDSAVVAVVLDPTRLRGETRYEPGSGGEPERFAHVYGPIGMTEVVEVLRDLPS